jgi:hypothetical protein
MVARKIAETKPRLFTVELRRTVVEHVSLSVEAASLEEARQTALESSDPETWDLAEDETVVTDAYPE